MCVRVGGYVCMFVQVGVRLCVCAGVCVHACVHAVIQLGSVDTETRDIKDVCATE